MAFDPEWLEQLFKRLDIQLGTVRTVYTPNTQPNQNTQTPPTVLTIPPTSTVLTQQYEYTPPKTEAEKYEEVLRYHRRQLLTELLKTGRIFPYDNLSHDMKLTQEEYDLMPLLSAAYNEEIPPRSCLPEGNYFPIPKEGQIWREMGALLEITDLDRTKNTFKMKVIVPTGLYPKDKVYGEFDEWPPYRDDLVGGPGAPWNCSYGGGHHSLSNVPKETQDGLVTGTSTHPTGTVTEHKFFTFKDMSR